MKVSELFNCIAPVGAGGGNASITWWDIDGNTLFSSCYYDKDAGAWVSHKPFLKTDIHKPIENFFNCDVLSISAGYGNSFSVKIDGLHQDEK